MKVPKYLDTSLLDVNINPHWVSVRVKDKLTQMKLQDEVIVERSSVQRSQVTGELTVRMQKLKPNYLLKRTIELEKEKIKREEAEEKKRVSEQKTQGKAESNGPVKTHDETTFDDVPELE